MDARATNRTDVFRNQSNMRKFLLFFADRMGGRARSLGGSVLAVGLNVGLNEPERRDEEQSS